MVLGDSSSAWGVQVGSGRGGLVRGGGGGVNKLAYGVFATILGVDEDNCQDYIDGTPPLSPSSFQEEEEALN